MLTFDADARLILERADQRRLAAENALEHLRLIDRLAVLGQPYIVGAMTYDVMVRPDIDLGVSCEAPDIAASFAVMVQIARMPGVRRVRFANALDEPDHGLYWHLRYRESNATPTTEWTFDIWLLAHDHPGPRSLT